MSDPPELEFSLAFFRIFETAIWGFSGANYRDMTDRVE
jgi:hypothetical protein